MQSALIQRKGSLLYTKAYRKVGVALTFLYLSIGALLALAAAYALSHFVIGAIVFLIVIGVVSTMWLLYLALLWVFRIEARQTVEITKEGVREMRDGREHAFIPWNGVKEIELAATIVAGASLRVKGSFSEIGISNVDLMITRPMSLVEMHKAAAQTTQIKGLLDDLKSAAPHAPLRMNKLARRRLRKYEWVRSL